MKHRGKGRGSLNIGPFAQLSFMLKSPLERSCASEWERVNGVDPTLDNNSVVSQCDLPSKISLNNAAVVGKWLKEGFIH